MKLFCLRIDLDRFQQVVVTDTRRNQFHALIINDDDKTKIGSAHNLSCC
jgi:phosphorylcholine metabolism protein LicD